MVLDLREGRDGFSASTRSFDEEHQSMIEVLSGLVLGLVLGYIAGRLDRLVTSVDGGVSVGGSPLLRSFSRVEAPHKKVLIDDTKYVTDVSTDDLEALGDFKLGTVTQSNDDISAAANKLAQLKSRKDK